MTDARNCHVMFFTPNRYSFECVHDLPEGQVCEFSEWIKEGGVPEVPDDGWNGIPQPWTAEVENVDGKWHVRPFIDEPPDRPQGWFEATQEIQNLAIAAIQANRGVVADMLGVMPKQAHDFADAMFVLRTVLGVNWEGMTRSLWDLGFRNFSEMFQAIQRGLSAALVLDEPGHAV